MKVWNSTCWIRVKITENESFSSDTIETRIKAKKEPFKEGFDAPKAIEESET